MSGSKPGERRGGKQKGSKNKATIERELQAARALTEAVATGKLDGQELAKDVLGRFMRLSEGAAGEFMPTPSAQLKQGKAENPNKDWDRFGEWVDRVIYCAKELAKYQSPALRAILVPASAPDSNQQERRKAFGLRIFEGGKPIMEILPPDRTKANGS